MYSETTGSAGYPAVVLTGPVLLRSRTGEDFSLNSQQERVALAMLTLDRSCGTTREELADTLWAGRPPSTWRSALRNVVSRVREHLVRAVELDKALVSRSGRYLLRLPSDVHVDLEVADRHVSLARQASAAHEAYAHASTASSILRRPFLPDHDSEWALIWRSRVAELLVTSLEAACDAAIALGETTAAVEAANEAARLAPIRESAHRCRMRAHAACGNRADALRAYEELRQRLGDELGIGPDVATEALYCQLLEQ